MTRRLRWIGCAGAGLALLTALAGCAPRVFVRTPEDVARYPYLSVSPEELANAKAVLVLNAKDPQAPFSQVLVALDAYQRQDWTRALQASLELKKRYPDSIWRPAADLLAARSQIKLKAYLPALAQLHALSRTPAGQQADFAVAVRNAARSVINDALDAAGLAQVQADYPGSPWAEQAMFVSGKRTLDEGRPGPAVELFSRFLAAYPHSEFAPAARQLMEKATVLVPVDRLRIGGLLPITGPYAPFGRAIQRGLELALAQVNAQRPADQSLVLTVVDAEGGTLDAAAGLRQLAETDRVLAVIGPVLSTSVRALLPELDRWRLPMISPSASDPDLVGRSPYFFRYLLTNEQQGEAMAEQVVLREGIKRIGLLHAQDRYDRSLADAFAAKAVQLGGEIVARADYPPGTTDFKEQMLALGGVDPGRMKSFEVEERKALDRGLERIVHDIAGRIAPAALIASQTPIPLPKATPIPEVRAAILRFAETGDQTKQEQLGRMITERFSYALAAKPGLEVLTQRQTLDALGGAGLAPEAVGAASYRKAGEALEVPYLVLGEVAQKGTAVVVTPTAAEATPFTYTLTVRLVEASGARELKRYTLDWVKRVPPGANLKQIEAVYLPVSFEDALQIAPQLAFYDLPARIFGPDAWLNAGPSRGESGESLNGAVVTAGFWPDDPDGAVQAFVRQYEAAYLETPPVLAVQAFDALRLLAKVLGDLPRSAGREQVTEQLRRVQGFPGITGTARVEPNGEVRRPAHFLIFKNGQWQKVK